MKPNFTLFKLFFCQVSGLTWFTRLDPVKPKQQVFAVEDSPEKMKSDGYEMSAITDREPEDVNGKANHHIRRGDFPSCLHSSNFTTLRSPLPLNAFCVLQILHPRCPASSPRPGSCLPSTGCVEWRGRRKDKTIQ